MTDEQLKRFWAKVNIPEDKTQCWNWLAGKDKNGYGRFSLNRVNTTSHSISFSIHKGSTKGLDILHKCNNPSCVNPDHLVAGTCSENQEDSYVAGTAKPFGFLKYKRLSEHARRRVLRHTLVKQGIISADTKEKQ